VQDERLEEKGKENITSPVRSHFLWMMNEQKVGKNNNQMYLSRGKRLGHFQIKAAFIATKKVNKEKGVSEQHVLCKSAMLAHLPLLLSSWFFCNLISFQSVIMPWYQ